MEWYPCNYSGGGTENKTVTFTKTEKRENIKSGEKHKALFGKIARWLADLKTVAFTGNYDDLSGKPSSMPASDVKAWAKAASKPSYSWSEISSKPSTFPPSSHTHAYLPLSGGTVSGNIAAGSGNTVTGNSSLVIGEGNKSAGNYGITAGYNNTNNSNNSLVSGFRCSIGGDDTAASLLSGEVLSVENGGHRTVCFGYSNNAKNDMLVMGHYSDGALVAAPHKWAEGVQGTAFTIGNGSGSSSRSNAFRVNYDGTIYSKGSYNTTGADYAEYFEWQDGNPDGEDRTGLFVTLDGGKIRLAGEGDYILGIISANPSVTGNSDEHWTGQFKKDVFNRYAIEERLVTVKEIKTEALTGKDGNPVLDEDGNPVVAVKETEKEVTARVYVENEGYDKDKGYTHRADRPEWDTVGLLGQLVCYDDGTCQENGYCKCGQNGTATAAAYGEGSLQTPVYRVMERVADNLIRVMVK